ncbi:unnamed protein product [Microthlaspi erraticum]|uniref:F-box/LRR-repeat protein 15/At3g58940/PEG3-like LRR domain-containing protein n=1 Tax=Microthlaspi erraticum TaxID=1685480 RepID=A0A6D2JM25_9BRAS|nr:unnamed protein product [Microthlaspi erraticum]
MKDAIATSVLSKQWQSLWKKMHELKFDYRDHNLTRGTFSKDVCTCLLSHKAPVLQSLHLNVHLDRCNPEDTGILIGVAFGLHVLKLVLEVQSIGQDFIFPRSLYTFKTLEILKLKCKVLIDLPSQLCLKSLRTLHLHYVDYKDDESVVNLLSGCPNLRTLSVHRHAISYTVNTFTIAVPSLQKLSIYNSHGGDQNWGYVINAPSLKYLKIKLFSGLGFFLIENVMTDLEEATIVIVPKIIDENILGSLTSVTRLSLKISPLAIKFPTESFFYQLVSLELHENKETWWNLLTSMLDISPKLQVLKLINVSNVHQSVSKFFKSVFACLLV